MDFVELFYSLREICSTAELDMGRVHPWVGLGSVGSEWVTLDDTEFYAKCNCKVYI